VQLNINSRQIIDSRGNPTIEVDVHLKDGSFGRAAVPSGASTGSREALEMRDNEEFYLGKSVYKAIKNIDNIIFPALLNLNVQDYRNIDKVLIDLDGTLNKSNLGANAILGVSLACACAASNYQKNLIGGSADLTGSNNTKAKDMNVITSNNFNGNYIHYGIREHGMAGVMNGIALHKGLIPYGGTFLVFTDYCRPSIRLSAIMNIPVIYVMTHDSIGLGEDGPTHQPVEHLASLRSIPNLTVIRPCDIIETIEAWECAINNTGPTILVLTRQNLPMLQKDNRKENLVNKGAHKIRDFKEYDATILSSGSEVEIACSASNKIFENNNLKIRVISMSSFELFEKNNDSYKNDILGNKPIFAIEAGVINGWEKYIKNENFVGMSTFGESGPYKDLYKHFKITDDHLIEKIIKTL